MSSTIKINKKYAVQPVAILILLVLVVNLYLPRSQIEGGITRPAYYPAPLNGNFETPPSQWHSPPNLIVSSYGTTVLTVRASGSGVEVSSWVVFTDMSGDYYAKSGKTDQLLIQTTNFPTIMNDIIANGADIAICNGTFTFTSTAISINNKHHVNIHGVGNETIFDRNYASSNPFIDIRGHSSDIEISGIQFNGHDVMGSMSYVQPVPVSVWFSDNIRLHDLFVTGIAHVYAAFVFQSCTRSSVKDCTGWNLGDPTCHDSQGSLLYLGACSNCSANGLTAYNCRGIVACADISINGSAPAFCYNIEFSDINAYNSTSCVWLEGTIVGKAEDCMAVKCQYSRWTYGAHDGAWGNSVGDFNVGGGSKFIHFTGCTSIDGAIGFYSAIGNTSFLTCVVINAGYCGARLGANSSWIGGIMEHLNGANVIAGILLNGTAGLNATLIESSRFQDIHAYAIRMYAGHSYDEISTNHFIDCPTAIIISASCLNTYIHGNSFLRCTTNIVNSGINTTERANYDADTGKMIADVGG